MIDPEYSTVILCMVGIATSSLCAVGVSIVAIAKADAAVDLARGTSERSQNLARMLGKMNDIVEELDVGLCKEIDKVKASLRELEP